MTKIEIKNKLKELNDKAEYIQSCIDDLEIEIEDAQDELSSYERKKERKEDELEDIEKEIEKLEREEPKEPEFYNDTYIENPKQLNLFK